MDKLSENTIGQWLEYWAQNDPDRDFVVYSDRNLHWTFNDVNERVDQMAKGMMNIGAGKGTHIGILANNVPDWITVLLACSKIGAVSIPVNTNFKRIELEDIMQRADMEMIFIVEHCKDNDYAEIMYRILPELKTQPLGQLHSTRFPKMKAVILMGTAHRRGMYTTVDLLSGAAWVKDKDYQSIKHAINAHDLTNIQFTSGTTGYPKGAMLSHYNICNNGYLTGVHLRFTPDSKLCLCVPFFHCFGLVMGIMNCLVHHCTMVICETFDPMLVLYSIAHERCTSLFGVPTMFLGILSHPLFKRFDLSSLYAGIMAGSICPASLIRRVEEEMGMIVCTEYGFTESSPGMTATRWDDPFDIRSNTVGKAFEDSVITVRDKDDKECPVGVEGELCNRGYNNMLGYYKDPESTAEILDKEGNLHTGDLGFKDEKGYFHISGRIKDMIIRGGENIYPHEIEQFLYHLPEIKIIQVVGVPSEKYGESVGAFIELKKGSTLQASDITDFCKDKIARYKVPKYIFFLKDGEWPLTGSGKIQKFKLKKKVVEICKKEGRTII